MEKSEVVDLIMRTKHSGGDTLDLSNKGIAELPEEVGLLTQLKLLDISYNQITALPASIGKLKKLEKLFILRNGISLIPAEIGNLSKLKVIDMSYNPIKVLPNEIGRLHNLEYLDASYCNLQKLPFELTGLLSLKSLNLDENHLQFPPQKLVQRGLYAIMHFLAIEKRRNEASRVVINIFNMPEKIQLAFKQYISLFSNIVTKINNKELKFDVNYINQHLYQQLELNTGIDSYLMEVIQFLDEKIKDNESRNQPEIQQLFIHTQLNEIKHQMKDFNNLLDEKVETLMRLKSEIANLYKLFDK
jgi:Leucine-rich repeat (LRR) protein